MATKIFNSYSDFLQREDKNENGVSKIFAANHPNWQRENESNKGAWGCSGCSRCSRCSDCSGCSDCSDCLDIAPAKQLFDIPKIENIHQKVLEAVTPPESHLEMSTWHTCATTHCRAGWVVTLAGEKGKELERRTSTEFAAMMIYKESSPIRVFPPRFYDGNEVAMKDIERCAEEEKNPIN